jgi:esterase/lipase
MKSWTDTLLFLYGLLSNRNSNCIQDVLPPIQSNIKLTRYYKHNSKHCRAIIIFHGINALGATDNRIKKLAQALSLAHYTVYVPHFPEVANHLMLSSVFNRVEAVIQTICSQYTDEQPVVVFAPSYMGSVALQLSTQLELRDKIKSICAIGSFCSLDHFLDFVQNSPHADSYAIAVYNKNLLFRHGSWSHELERAYDLVFDQLIDEGTTSIDPLQFPKLSPVELDYAQRATCQTLLNELVKIDRSTADPFPAFHLENKLHTSKAQVTLLHGLHDHIIPSSHSQQIASSLPKNRHRILITPLLTHGDHKLSLKQVSHIIKMLKTLKFFFKSARA